jgi:hypothetical protein
MSFLFKPRVSLLRLLPPPLKFQLAKSFPFERCGMFALPIPYLFSNLFLQPLHKDSALSRRSGKTKDGHMPPGLLEQAKRR